MAIYAPLFIARASVHYVTMCQHRSPFIWNIKKVAVAFETLFIFERGICPLTRFLMIIFPANKVHNDILNSMSGLGIEEIKRVMWCRKMAVHAIGHKSLAVVCVG